MNNKKFTIVQLFSLVDGRLSTKMDDVYEMLNHIIGDSLMTHHLPVAMNYVKDVLKPDWFYYVDNKIKEAINIIGTDNFQPLIEYLQLYNEDVEVGSINKEMNVEFGSYMINNSLLLK